MAARGHHRAIGVIDLPTAAVAEHFGAVILRYHADFEHLAVTPVPQAEPAQLGAVVSAPVLAAGGDGG